ncbi:hypothetical protein GCM10010172_83700 [Paractinoplanes ferrugineus]|uniref:Uncharacterized protein n=1 Tax=Paractinoplanes ferrugineus TaxID=113564 RepID=A0A919IX50_9ACTN|nr:hypothetical protein [Actinoplanes ferrugineus]GIE10691.1 hypothetical protein Afe05nite_25310 [Actinoplanes ferrugineus]
MSTLEVDRPVPTRRSRPWGLIVAGVVALAAAGLAGLAALNGDVTYALGGLETAGRGGVSVWDVFVARPVAYRLMLGSLDLTGSLDMAFTHRLIRAEADLVIVAVAVLLHFGLRRHLAGPVAAGIAAATGATLLIAPPWHFLEPDWMAALAAVVAVGAGLAPRRHWLGALLGGLAAVLVVAVKLATAPIALIALIAIAVLSRRRAVWVAVATGVLAVVWYATTKHFLPWEWIWLKDQADLVADSPIHHGLRLRDFRELAHGLGDATVLSPVIAVAPAAFAALVHRLPTTRQRLLGAAVAVVASGLSVASAYGQAEFYMYHYAIVPVLAAAVWGAAFALCPGARLPLVVSTVALAVLSFVALRQPAGRRLAHYELVENAYLLAAVGTAVIVWTVSTRSVPWPVGSVALTLALVPPVLLGAPYSFSTYDYKISAATPNPSGYAAVSERIGRDTPVLYLSFGAVNHAMGNPTSCRYPSPQWLQRGTKIASVREYRSYADNLACLTQDSQARYLIVQTDWFKLDKAPADVKELLDARFDCSPAARLPRTGNLVVCPAR